MGATATTGRLGSAPSTDLLRQSARPTRTGPAVATSRAHEALSDEHTVLLWQICAYVEEFTNAAQTGRELIPAFDSLLTFLHYRLLPYLTAEERQLPGKQLTPEECDQQRADHNEIRDGVEAIEAAETEARSLIATATLVTRIDEHTRREQSWITDNGQRLQDVGDDDALAHWAFPLLITDDVDVDTLPAGYGDELVLTRLLRMRCGETLRLRAGHDLRPLWRQLRARNQGEHAWVYETTGPRNWVACITRREIDCT